MSPIKKKIFLRLLSSLILFVTMSPCFVFSDQKKENIFRFSLFTEPHVIDPAKLSGSESHYVVSNLFRGLFSFDDEKGLTPLGAKQCKWQKNRTLLCSLNTNLKWNDGSAVIAEDYVRSFRHFIDPAVKSRESGLLLSLKNAKQILDSKMSVDQLGIKAKGDYTLEFSFSEQDEDFLHKLASPLLVPIKMVPVKGDIKTYYFNGPYVIKEWVAARRIFLEPNSYYPFGNKNRPALEILFVEEAATALDMYKVKKLDFVLELPISEISALKNREDFFRTPLARFDYFGFGPELIADTNLRIALAHGADYEEFKKVFDALGRPGCPSLPDFFMNSVPCYSFDLKKAKEAFTRVKPETLKKRYKLYFTKIPSNNLKMVAEWYQSQWKKNLGFEIELVPMEFGMYRQILRTEPPALFRVGVTLDRPTCLAALETFVSTSSDNYIRFKNLKYDELIKKLMVASTDERRRKLCSDGIAHLLSEYTIIPQGQIHFARLLNTDFVGLKINSMGQMDFSNLRKKSLQ